MDNRKETYRSLFNSQAGKVVLSDLEKRYSERRAFNTNTDGSAMSLFLAYAEGQRDLIREIKDLVKED